MGFFYKLGTAFRMLLQFIVVYLQIAFLEFIGCMILVLIFKWNDLNPIPLFIGTAIVMGILYILAVLNTIVSNTWVSANKDMDELDEEYREQTRRENETMTNLALKDYHWKRGRWF